MAIKNKPPRLKLRILGQGENLVLVHGWAMHSGVWLAFAEQLACYYRVILVDLPGHGGSETLDEFNLANTTELLIQSVPESAYWLGWSLGATISLHIASAHPERVKGLILLAGNPHFHTRAEESDWHGVNSEILHLFVEQLQTNPQQTLLKFTALQILGLPNYKTLLAELKTALALYPVPDNAILKQGLAILEQNDLRAELAHLTVPTAAIFGEKDTLVPASIGQKMQALLPHLHCFYLKNAGHIPFLTHETELVSLIRAFINNVNKTL